MTSGFWSGAGSGIIAGTLGLLGAGMNQGFSAINSSRQARNTKKVLDHQDYLNREYTRDSYGIMREGLKKAGYNPLLALGSSANSASYGGSAGLSDSDQGSEAISGAIDAMRFKNEKKLNEATVEKLDEEKKGVELDNKLKEANLNTNPRKVISDFIEDKSNKTLNFIKDKLGISNSAKSNSHNNIRINLSDKKPYVQKGVPHSVVKNFQRMNSNSAVSSKRNNEQLGIWNSSKKIYGHVLNDSEVRHYIKKKFNGSFSRPPKSFPSGM